MRVTELSGLRDYWYAVARVDRAGGGPSAVRLFGEEYVWWRPEGADPVLVEAHCPHRGAHLAAGSVCGDRLVCCYHGWEFDPTGACTRIPQLETGVPIPGKARLSTFPVVAAYGLWWACVGEPASAGPPGFHEADELGWRVRVDFFETWRASALRILDNNLDQAHPAFVHQGTFGDPTRPLVARYRVEATPSGFRARVPQDVGGVGPQMGVADEAARFDRLQEVELLDPVHTRIRLRYEGRAPDYAFYGSATPIDDERSLYVRVSALAGDEDTQPYAMFWDYSRRVTDEDRVVLETTSPDFPLDPTSEVHLRCDKTTLEFRRLLGGLAGGGAGASSVRRSLAQSPLPGPAA